MARIMVLAESGFGKTTSLGPNPDLGIKGLDSTETLIIQPTNKGLPFPKNKSLYTPVVLDRESGTVTGNLYHAPNAEAASKMVLMFLKHRPEVINFVLDDFNFFMQDFYMSESAAKKQVFGIFNEIGGQTSGLIKTIDLVDAQGKNSIILAHSEIYEDLEGRKRFKFKTVGSMVDKYVTPEGRFEIVLMGKAFFDPQTKVVSKKFVTNDDGTFNAKSPYGMFKDLYVLNDMGLVIDKINEFNN